MAPGQAGCDGARFIKEINLSLSPAPAMLSLITLLHLHWTTVSHYLNEDFFNLCPIYLLIHPSVLLLTWKPAKVPLWQFQKVYFWELA